MRRKLFTLAAGVSAVLFVATALLWVRSYRAADTYVWLVPARLEAVQSARGRLWYFRAESIDQAKYPLPRGMFPAGYQAVFPPLPSRLRSKPRRQFAGFSYAEERPFALRLRSVSAPDWSLVAMFSGAPALALLGMVRRTRTRTRARTGRCPACGYDLRATPGRCPECGAVPAAPTAGKGAA